MRNTKLQLSVPEFSKEEKSKEQWRSTEIVGYEVSSLGRVRSYYKNRYLRLDLPPTIKQQVDNKHGRLVVNLKRKVYLVSRLVAIAFLENPEKKPQVRHLNSCTYDNRIQNLAWGTDSENKQDYAQSIVHAGYPKNRVRYQEVESCFYLGLQETYDLEVEAPWHNFTCNKVVVHNSESARYKELKDKHYIPNDFLDKKIKMEEENLELIKVLDKIGHKLDSPTDTWGEALEVFSLLGEQLYHEAIRQLTPEVGRKRAKESSRYFLTYNKQLTYSMIFNLRSFNHFVKLRATDQAQKEVKDIAREMLRQVYEVGVFNDSLDAFGLREYL